MLLSLSPTCSRRLVYELRRLPSDGTSLYAVSWRSPHDSRRGRLWRFCMGRCDTFYMMQKMHRFESGVAEEIAAEQVRHVDLAEYQPGHPHYEALQESIRLANRFTWPKELTQNV